MSFCPCVLTASEIKAVLDTAVKSLYILPTRLKKPLLKLYVQLCAGSCSNSETCSEVPIVLALCPVSFAFGPVLIGSNLAHSQNLFLFSRVLWEGQKEVL